MSNKDSDLHPQQVMFICSSLFYRLRQVQFISTANAPWATTLSEEHQMYLFTAQPNKQMLFWQRSHYFNQNLISCCLQPKQFSTKQQHTVNLVSLLGSCRCLVCCCSSSFNSSFLFYGSLQHLKLICCSFLMNDQWQFSVIASQQKPPRVSPDEFF